MRRVDPAAGLATRLMDYFVPMEAALSDPDERRRGQLIVSISAFALVLGPAYLALYVSQSQIFSAVAICGATLGIVAAPLLVRATRSAAPAGNSIAAALLTVIAAMTWETGGFHAPGLVWVATLPIAGFCLAGLRSGAVWSGVATVFTAALFLTEPAHVSAGGGLSESARDQFTLAAILGLTAVVALFAVEFESHKDRALSALSAANDYLSDYDRLTGLPNRSTFTKQLERALARSDQNDHDLALLYLGVDRFKQLNQSIGTAGADQLLLAFADRLRYNLRLSDIVGLDTKPSHMAISRLEGAEFTILLSRLSSEGDAEAVAKRVLALASEPFRIDTALVEIDCSIGVAFTATDGQCADALLRNADAAMYQARSSGGNRYCFCSPALNRRAGRKLTLERALREAI